MKKSIIVMMVAVLLISALFVSCKQEIATPQDSLGTVQVSLPSSRTLTPGTPTSNIPEVTNWYYVATKVSGYYHSGQTEWASLDKMQEGQQVGNTFSAGDWKFSFYGFNNTATKDDKTSAIYYAEDIELTVVGQDTPNYIDVVLQGGAIPAATVTFKSLTFGNEALPGNFTVKINGEVATFTDGECTFTNVAEGDHTYVVTVWTGPGATAEKIGEAAPVKITVNKGYDYSISGAVEGLDSLGIVVIRTVEYLKSASDTKAVTTGAAVTFTTNVAPDGDETTVAFGTDSGLSGTYKLETTVSGSEAAGAFVISSGSSVASIDLSLKSGDTAVAFDGKATITTKIAKGLHGVSVVFNGTGDAPTDVSYDDGTGVLTFKTSHFSQFIVVSSDEIIVSDGTAYATLADFAAAVNGGNSFIGKTVYLMKDVTLSDGWEPIGNTYRNDYSKVFEGTFEGKDHTITGLKNDGVVLPVDSDSEYVYGLFGVVRNATIRNLKLADVSITNESKKIGSSVGAVVGFGYGGITIENCEVSGSIEGQTAGGIIGRIQADGEKTAVVKYCRNNASVTGNVHDDQKKPRAAGIVGYAAVGKSVAGSLLIEGCENNGTVKVVAQSDTVTLIISGVACYGYSNVNQGEVEFKNNTNKKSLVIDSSEKIGVGTLKAEVATNCWNGIGANAKSGSMFKASGNLGSGSDLNVVQWAQSTGSDNSSEVVKP